MDVKHKEEYFIGLAVTLLVYVTGITYGWSAPMFTYLTSEDSVIPITSDQGSWILASIEIGNMITPMPTGILADKFGRKPIICLMIPVIIISWIMVKTTRSYFVLILVRIIHGMGLGGIFTVGPMYLGEIAEPHNRGRILNLTVVMFFMGVVTSYGVGSFISYNNFPYFALIFPLLTIALMPYVLESPYYLISRNKLNQAYDIIMKLRNLDDESTNTEINIIRASLQEECSVKMTPVSIILDPVFRKCITISLMISFTCVLGGISIILFYVTDIFAAAKTSYLDPEWCTIIIGFIFLFMSIISTVLIDKIGRKPLLMISGYGCGLCHFITGLYFYINNEFSLDISGLSWILPIAIGGYCAFVSVGLFPLGPIYLGEIYPTGVKGIGTGVANISTCIFSLVAIKMFPILNSSFGMHISFWILSFINLFGSFILSVNVIETKGKSLVQIQNELIKLTRAKKPDQAAQEIKFNELSQL